MSPESLSTTPSRRQRLSAAAAIPQAPEMERALLSGLLQSPRYIGPCVDFLRSAECLMHPAHRVLWRQLAAMSDRGLPIDLITVTQALRDAGTLENCGGAAWVADINFVVPTGANWKYYAEKVREKWILRQALEIANGIRDAVLDPAAGSDVTELACASLARIAGLAQSRSRNTPIREAVTERFDYWEDLLQRKGQPEGLGTGLPLLDRAIRGLRPGTMHVIAAPTKSGKTALALNIASHNALAGHGVGIFSLEMTTGQLVDRLAADVAQMDVSALGRREFLAEDLDRLRRGALRLAETRVILRDETAVTPAQLRAAARVLVANEKCELLVVDYLQLIEPAGTIENREQQVAEASRTMKAIARELNVPVLVLSQLNDQGRTRESRAIEQDCDTLTLIEVERDAENPSPATDRHYLHVKLARDCPSGRIPVVFRREITKFLPAAEGKGSL